MTINITETRDELLTEFGKAVLKDRYLLEGESIQQGFARAAEAHSDDSAHAQRIYDYASKLWFMFSSPILSNSGTKKGLPISCFLNYVEDSRLGLNEHVAENSWLSSMGGGIGGYWGHIRSDGSQTSSGSKSTGSIPFMHWVDSQMLAFSQGTTRRGSYAAYQDMSHPEIVEFIEMRKPTGGDVNRKCLNLHHGVNIPDAFMEAVWNDEPWDLIDPNSKEVTQTLMARELWEKLLETRMATGEPYIHWIDETNRKLPQHLKDFGLKVHHSNLCSEITLPTNEGHTAVCCLSSVNLDKYDEWKDDPLFIEDLIRFLDNVLTNFCEEAPNELWRAVQSVKRERSLGLGAMGFHSYLQKQMIPLESPMAVGINKSIFKSIKEKADAATKKLAGERSECGTGLATGLRNSHLIAIAPNASSSIICGGVSPSIEPVRANAYTHKTDSGSFLVKNKYLDKLLSERLENTEKTWKSIVLNNGSVQHLDFLDDWEKQVFKTAEELDQAQLVELASHRQPYICQAQSLNLFFPADVDRRTLHNVHMRAWKGKLKTLYYCRSGKLQGADKVSEKIERLVRPDGDDEGCLSCEG